MGWYSPLHRAVLPLDGLRVTRSLRKMLPRYEIRVDTAFEGVLAGCADPRPAARLDRPADPAGLPELHERGIVHSVEAWTADGELAGGLYGVSLGGLFAGESMFHRPDIGRDASKVALVALVDLLVAADADDRLLDVQWVTPHLARWAWSRCPGGLPGAAGGGPARVAPAGLAGRDAIDSGACPRCPRWSRSRGSSPSGAWATSIARVELTAFSALKTYDPPLSALHGLEVDGGDPARQVHRLSSAGACTWCSTWPGPAGCAGRTRCPTTPAKPGKGPLALRVRLDDGSGFDLTEAGTQRKLAVHVVDDPQAIPMVATLGPDPLTEDFDEAALGAILASAGRVAAQGRAQGPADDRRDRQRLLRRDPARGQAEPVQAGELADRGGAGQALRRHQGTS